jgi:hypothetical protein
MNKLLSVLFVLTMFICSCTKEPIAEAQCKCVTYIRQYDYIRPCPKPPDTVLVQTYSITTYDCTVEDSTIHNINNQVRSTMYPGSPIVKATAETICDVKVIMP